MGTVEDEPRLQKLPEILENEHLFVSILQQEEQLDFQSRKMNSTSREDEYSPTAINFHCGYTRRCETHRRQNIFDSLLDAKVSGFSKACDFVNDIPGSLF